MISLNILLVAIGPTEGAEEEPLADLEVTGIDVVAGDNHYLITITLENVGDRRSMNVSSSLFDEFDISGGDEELIKGFNVPPLDPGDVHTEEVRWIRESVGFHRIWAVADVDSSMEEIRKTNNILYKIVELPSIRELWVGVDGDPDPDRAGFFFTGVDLPLNISASFSGLMSPEHMLTYMNIDDGPKLLYAPTDVDGVSRHTLNMGTLKSGVRNLTVNASSSGFPLEERTLKLDVRELPTWADSLKSREVYFDREMGCYVLDGYHDLPAMNYVPDHDDADLEDGITIFGPERDIRITAYVRPSGVTTILIRGDVEIIDPAGKRSVHIHGKGHYPSLFEEMEMEAEGSSQISLDLHRMVGKGGIRLGIGVNETSGVNPHFEIQGIASISARISIGPGGLETFSEVAMDLSGEVNFTSSRDILGFDNPISAGKIAAQWSLVHRLSNRGKWTSTGGLSLEINGSLLDLGLDSGGQIKNESVPETGISISTDEEEAGSIVFIPYETGSMSSIYYRHNGNNELAYQSNLHKSWPTHADLGSNRSLIVWSESASYGEDQKQRFSSLGIRYLMRRGPTNYTDPATLFTGDHADTRTHLARSPSGDEASLVWMRDGDGDPLTIDDTSIMFSRFREGSFSPPAKISGDGGGMLPDVTYSRNGDLWVVWLDGESLYIRVYEEEARSWSTIESAPPLPEGGIYLDVSLSDGPGEEPYLLYIRNGGDREENYVVATRKVDPSRRSLIGDEEVISESPVDLEDVSAYRDRSGDVHAVWCVGGADGDQLRASRRLESAEEDPWLDPVSVTGMGSIKFSPRLIPVSDGYYLTTWFSVNLFDNRSLGAAPAIVIEERNLSSSARIVSMDSSMNDYEVGDAVIVTVRLENTGLSARSRVSVDITRAMRDPISGKILGQILQSKSTDFTGYRDNKVVEFPVTVVEHQLGLSTSATGSWSDGKSAESERYLPLMAVQDPEIEDMVVTGEEIEGGNMTATITVKNHGKVSTGSRRLTLWSSSPRRPVSFPGGLEQPPLMNLEDTYTRLNYTDINLPPGGRADFHMNFTMRPGIFSLMATIEPYAWEEESRSLEDPVEVSCLPRFDITLNRSSYMGSERDVSVDVVIRNTGSTTLDDLKSLGGDPPETMEYINYTPQGYLIWDLQDNDTPLSFQGDLGSLAPGGSVTDNLLLRIPNEKGLHRFRIGIFGKEVISDSTTSDSAAVIGLHRGDLEIRDKASSLKVLTSDRNLNVKIGAGGDRHFRAAVLRLYNGMVRDDVVISRSLVTQIDREGIEAGLPMDLDEGLYTVTVSIYGYPDDATGDRGDEMVLMDQWTIKLNVEKKQAEEPEDDELDLEQLGRSSLIAVATLAIVFGLALAWRFKDSIGGEE